MAEQDVDTVVMEVSSHALTLGRVDGISLRGGRFLHQSGPARSPRLPPDDGGLLRGQGSASVRPRIAPRRRRISGGVRRRRRRPRDGPPRRRQGDDRQREGSAVRRLARRKDVHAGERGAPRSSPPSTRPVCTTGCGLRCPGDLQRRQLPCGTGRLLDAVGVSPEQAAPGLRRPRRSRAGSSRSTAARVFSRWSTTRTSQARCRPCCETAAAPRAPAAWPWCSAPAAIATRVNVRRWAASPPNWPTWWWSPTTTPATRIPPRSGPRSWRERPLPAARGRWSRSATVARPSTARWRGRDPVTSC